MDYLFMAAVTGALLVVAALLWRSPVLARVTGRYGDRRLVLRVEVSALGGWLHGERERTWTPAGVGWPQLERFLASERSLSPERVLSWGRAWSPWGVDVDRLAGCWRVARLEASLTLGLDSPALTAVAHGLAWGCAGAVLAALQARWPVATPPRVDVRADFRGRHLSGDFLCILTFTVGDAVIAGWPGLKNRFARRLVRETA